MATDFIGVQMLVTLRDPPVRLKGTVSAVEAGSGLTLSNVWMLDTNKWEPRVTIASSNIIDLSEIPNATPTALAPPNPFPVQQTQIPMTTPTAPALTNPFTAAQQPRNPALPTPPTAPRDVIPQQPPLKPAFVDPAILAMGKRPGSLSLPSRVPEANPKPNTSEKRDPEPVVIPSVHIHNVSRDITPIAQAADSLSALNVDSRAAAVESGDEELVPEASLQAGQTAGQKKKRRSRRPGGAKAGAQEDAEASPQAPKAADRGKGWRQTPILQSTSSFQPFNSLKKTANGRQANENGWASEDVTDVQEAGDFDFEGGLAKFDKQQIFEQMRKEDKVDDADRLVSHNRQSRAKLGTGGGKNYHHSENVLGTAPVILKANKDKPTKEPANDFWNSEADDGALNGGERLSGRELGMGSRQGSRRGESKVSAGRRSQSRKASGATPVAQGLNRVNSGVSHYRAHSVKGSRPSSRLSANAVVIDKAKQLSTPANSQGLYTLPSNRRIEPVSALQMLNLENIAHNEIGLTEEMMTENAGRGIAEVTLTALSDPAIKVRHSGSVDASGNPPPQTVVVLAGNNKSGIRAVAAARHLRNKGINIIVCLVGLERGERDLFEDMRQQVRLYKNLGGRVFSKSDFFEYIRKISIPMLTIDTPRTSLSSLANPAPVMLILDALLGLTISFEELRNGDQATVYELIEWANRNEAFVLAVDIPTGIDPSSGKVSVIDGNRLYVKPRYVVAVGAPKRGLLEAMVAADNDDGDTVLAGGAGAAVPDDGVTEWKLFLADMGLGPAVWKKAGTKNRRGIDFEDKWVLQMRFQGLVVEEDEI
ncbi:YjeF-related protein N-terminus-domain-containing protein [Lasiosphaeria hispida]|uniref:Enhancer of mRNA-decapping protein 3 n=1 Tax=Lasiosphaeria hispida TaxID=260671 RepID=A0AAJ0HLV2_9PEZI|nr:YjeF-related protein N-terminus-domain-containing protein [Lasiosphaeria hispida]